MPKRCRHDTNDGPRCAIDYDRAAENIRARVQGVAPKIIADDHHRSAAFLPLVRSEIPTAHGWQRENIEEIGRNQRRRNGARGRTIIQPNDRSAAGSAGDILENIATKFAKTSEG